MQEGARREKLISLEISRFIAALAVALEHLSTTVGYMGLGRPPLTAPASAAVVFFFVLSGFVIHNAHWQDSGRLARIPRYFWRRAWRIFPLYWLSLVPMLVVLGPGCTPPYLLKIFTLSPFTGDIAELNPPAWSLRWELSFYMMFGLILLPYARRVVLPLWIGLVLWRWYPQILAQPHPAGWLMAHNGFAARLLSINNIMFFAGLAAGWLYVRQSLRARTLWMLLGLSTLLLLAMLRLDGWGTLYSPNNRLPFTVAAYAGVIFSLAALERGLHLRLPQRLGALGAMSYPLYLLHPGAAFIFSAYFFYHPAAKIHFTALPMFALLLGLSLLAAAAAALIDAPLQRLARRII